MNVSEAIERIKLSCIDCGSDDCGLCDKATEIAIQSLEIQDKLKQWIEGYKRQEFADMTLTMDGLIDILEEFRLECGE